MEKIFTITLNHSFEDTIDNSLYTTLTEEDAMLLNYDHVQIKLRFTDMDVMYYKAKKEQNNLYKSLIIENDGSSVESEIAFFSPNTLVITTETLSTGGGGGESDIRTLDISFVADNTTWTYNETDNVIEIMLNNTQATQLQDFLNTYVYRNGNIVIGLNVNNTPSVFQASKLEFNCKIATYNNTIYEMATGGLTMSADQKHLTFEYFNVDGMFAPVKSDCENDIALNVLGDNMSDTLNLIVLTARLGTFSSLIQLLNTINITIHLEGQEV